MIFYWLVKEKKVKLTYELPPNEELKNKIYYKWHGKWTHNTNNCTTFREAVQKWIKNGILKFPTDKLIQQVDKNPFLAEANVNMVVTDLTPLTKPANFRKPSQAPNKMKSVVSNPEKWNPNAMPYKAKAALSFNTGNPHQSYFLSSQSIQDLATTGNSILCAKCADQLAIPFQDKTNQNS